MNQTDLENEISKCTGYTKAAIGEILNAFKDIVVKTTAEGDSVKLSNFGVFTTKKLKSHKAWDFRNENIVEAGEKEKLAFACSKNLVKGVERIGSIDDTS